MSKCSCTVLDTTVHILMVHFRIYMYRFATKTLYNTKHAGSYHICKAYIYIYKYIYIYIYIHIYTYISIYIYICMHSCTGGHLAGRRVVGAKCQGVRLTLGPPIHTHTHFYRMEHLYIYIYIYIYINLYIYVSTYVYVGPLYISVANCLQELV